MSKRTTKPKRPAKRKKPKTLEEAFAYVNNVIAASRKCLDACGKIAEARREALAANAELEAAMAD